MTDKKNRPVWALMSTGEKILYCIYMSLPLTLPLGMMVLWGWVIKTFWFK